jgi:hypothetical protein
MKKSSDYQAFAINLGYWLWFKMEDGKATMFDWDKPIEINPVIFWAAFKVFYTKK